MAYTWEQAIEVIRRADSGELDFTIGVPWEDWGEPSYKVAGGWEFFIFDDGGQWDYIDHVICPDGSRLDTDGVDIALWGYRPVEELSDSYERQWKWQRKREWDE